MKIGVNNLCPCGSNIKFKKCCLKKGINYNERMSHDDFVRHLTIRGKNLYFINRVAEALQFDRLPPPESSFSDFIKHLKKAITPNAVRDIHLAIPEIWPDANDLNRCLGQEELSSSGLYLGNYLLDVTLNVFNRHALYNHSIIMIDPFQDPRIIKPEFNPVHNPEELITTTFRNVLLLFQLSPLIDAGIVKLIRDPGDFDYQLQKQMWTTTRNKLEKYPELHKFLEMQEMPPEIEDFFKDQFVLSHSEDYWVNEMKDLDVPEKFIRHYFRVKREQSTNFIELETRSQLVVQSCGTNYEMGKYICNKLGSHIITDFGFRWKEIEHDREVNGIEIDAWSTFSKAFQETKIKHLNGLMLTDLLRLRNDGYLEDMRAFLRRVWTASSSGNSFSKNDVENLTAELIGHISNAESEWHKIDSNLLKWFGGESIFGTMLGVVSGTATWVPAAAIAGAGAVCLGQAMLERKSFLKRYPAGFFIETIRKKT